MGPELGGSAGGRQAFVKAAFIGIWADQQGQGGESRERNTAWGLSSSNADHLPQGSLKKKQKRG